MNTDKTKTRIWAFCAGVYLAGTAMLVQGSGALDALLSGRETPDLARSFQNLSAGGPQASIFLLADIMLLTGCLYLALSARDPHRSDVAKVTDDIYIPVAAGEGQYGTARFALKSEHRRIFDMETLDPSEGMFAMMIARGAETKAGLEIETARRAGAGKAGNGGPDAPQAARREDGTNKAGGGQPDFYVVIDDRDTGGGGADADMDGGAPDMDYCEAVADGYRQRVEGQETDVLAAAEMEYYRGQAAAAAGEAAPPARDPVFRPPWRRGGLVVGMEKTGDAEKWYLNAGDRHNLVVGATRSGKSRSLVIQSIFAMAMGGEGMVITDPKGELYGYTSDFLRDECGYRAVCIDFRSPLKSDRYNLLQPVIDAMARRDVDGAEQAAWDLTNILVGDGGRGERIWENGEKAIIGGAILSVVHDNRLRPQYQNLTNVYWFVAEMAKEISTGIGAVTSPLEEYADALPDGHPAKAVFAIADVAPGRTKGSFYTSALTTLRLFNLRHIFGITHMTDMDIARVGDSRMALYIILPDERTTFYPVASLIISQLYEILVRQSDRRGGRLANRVNFICDEFGNFTKLTDFTNKLTVGGGRGILFHLFLQSFTQLEQKYDKETAAIIKGNCETWIYLKTEDTETHGEISRKLGKYTTTAHQTSSSGRAYAVPQESHSVSLVGRDLLFPDEVGRIRRPWQLVIIGGLGAVMQSADLSKWHLNTMLAMGDEDHNTALRLIRDESRAERGPAHGIPLWGIWDDIRELLEEMSLIRATADKDDIPGEIKKVKEELRLTALRGGNSANIEKRDAKLRHRGRLEARRNAET